MLTLSKSTHLLSWMAKLGFSPCCLLCQQGLERYQRICEVCIENLPWAGTGCLLCARSLEISHICGECLKKPPVYDRLFVPLDYAFPIDQLVLGGKFSTRLQNLALLADLFITYWHKKEMRKPDLLVPVPLHPKRLRERGYNQALEIARIIGRRLDIPVKATAVARIKATQAQAGLSGSKRRTNIKNAFALTEPIDGLHIAVIDDVFTTGSTVNALSQVLRRAGAAQIDIYCMAHSI